MGAIESAFIHEAEVQRQHARHRLPIKVVLRDTVFSVTDWSLGGLSIDLSGIDWDLEFSDGPQVGELVPLQLLFEFVGFTFSLAVNGEIRNWQSETKRTVPTAPSVKSSVPLLPVRKAEQAEELQRLGVQFVNLTPQQSAFLRYLLDAYIAGELVEAADLLEVVARCNRRHHAPYRNGRYRPALPVGRCISASGQRFGPLSVWRVCFWSVRSAPACTTSYS
ncbi:MAG: PilZ domain-containing protein [Candidatus Competibacteraceae bacterium]|nr:PilZ domain-containing protein [Candidatus Competibacteraceae bacterium]